MLLNEVKMLKKNPYIEFFLCFFLGFFGAHRFYLKKYKTGILYFFTIGLLGIGWFIDLFLILIKIFKNSNSNKLNTYNELAYIDNLSNGWQFENYIANLLKKLGYSNVKVTSGSGDYGVDVLASKAGIRYAFQCKLYRNPVGVKAVQEVVSGKIYYNCDKAVVITNNYFTSAAQKLANATGVELWDRNVLWRSINQIRKFVKNDLISNINSNPPTENDLTFDYDDALLLDAINHAFTEKTVSVAYFQRKLRIGYNHSQELITQMIDLGILSRNENSRGYDVLVTRQEFLLKYKKSAE